MVKGFNYRSLAPYLLQDLNDNRGGVRYDELGLVTQTFVMGKETEYKGDWMDTASLEISAQDQPSSIVEYEFRYYNTNGLLPNRVKAAVREKHYYKDNENNQPEIETDFRWQESYAYSDGSGHEVLHKIQAEPGKAPERDAQGKLVKDATGKLQEKDTDKEVRWVGNGRTIFNNKGNPVKQYEPYFDSTPEYNTESELTDLGYSSVLFYDAVSRVIRTEHPNGTFSKVAFDAWKGQTWDENDTVLDSQWYGERINGQKGEAEKEAAQRSAVHYNTPATTYLDSLGRAYLSVAHNRCQRSGESVAESFSYTRTEYDLEGNSLRVIDDRNNPVMTWKYNMLGTACFQHSMDAGDRWMLNDVMGKPMRFWDTRKFVFGYEYDVLHRPIRMNVADSTGGKIYEQYEYGEGLPDAKTLNLRGKLFRHFDTAGVVVSKEFDFKGNGLRSLRQLLKDYKNVPDWKTDPELENETFISETRYDALNRPVQTISPDKSIIYPQYNEANLLNRVEVQIKGKGLPTAFVTNIDYNAKGQRVRIYYGNNTTTGSHYELKTNRLIRLLTTADLGSRILQDLNYTYDPVGNITYQYDNAQKTIFYGGQEVKAQSNYWYDSTYQLIEAEGREHTGQVDFGKQDNWNDNWCRLALQPDSPIQLRNYTQKYFYDSVGNIEEMQHAAVLGSWTRAYDYNSINNQLLQTKVGSYNYQYTYNEHGSMTKMPHLTQMEWNCKEELQHIGLGGGGEAWYVYDSSGQRTRKVIEKQGGEVEERIYLGGFEVYRKRKDGSFTLERETIHVMDDQQRIAMIETRTTGNDGSPEQLTRYQYSNHLGSACLELDEAALIISYEEYHPYGTTAYQATDATRQVPTKRYRYTGMERDEESGLNYHSARYYVPWLGRWAGVDPIGVKDGFNVYKYVSNNPIRLIDLNGMEESPSIWEYTKFAARVARVSAETFAPKTTKAIVDTGQGLLGAGEEVVDTVRGIHSFARDPVEGVKQTYESGKAAAADAGVPTAIGVANTVNPVYQVLTSARDTLESKDARSYGHNFARTVLSALPFGRLIPKMKFKPPNIPRALLATSGGSNIPIQAAESGTLAVESNSLAKKYKNVGGSSEPSIPKAMKSDVDGGPHAPNNPEKSVRDRARIPEKDPKTQQPVINSNTELPIYKPQGRWLDAKAAHEAAAKADMSEGPHSVPIPEGTGEVWYGLPGPGGTLTGGGVMIRKADRAFVKPRADINQVHTFPIDENHPLYYKNKRP